MNAHEKDLITEWSQKAIELANADLKFNQASYTREEVQKLIEMHTKYIQQKLANLIRPI